MVYNNFIMPLTDRQLRAELSRLDGEPADALESEQLEFKEWIPGSEQVKKQLRQLREAVVAFANASGGHIVLGVRDWKQARADAIQGLDQLDTRDLQKNIYDGTDPHILVEISELLEPEGRLYAIRVPKGMAVHTTTEGVARVRVARETKPLTGSSLRALLETRDAVDYTAEILPELKLPDLDSQQILLLRDTIRENSGRTALAELPDRELLEGLELLRNDKVTRAAALLLGRRDNPAFEMPEREFILLRMNSDTDYSHRLDLNEPLLETLSRAQKFIEASPRLHTVNAENYRQLEIPDLSWLVAREAILNAITHRDYFQRRSSSFVRLYATRVEFSSPGGFVGGVTPENILRHGPERRNPLLASVFQMIGLVNRAGVGVDRMYTELLKQGKGTPGYWSSEGSVHLTIPTSVNADFVCFVREEEQEKRALGLDDLIVLHGMTRRGSLNAREAGKILHLPWQEAKPKLAELRGRGYLVPAGRGQWVSYRLAPVPARRLNVQLRSEDENWVDAEELKLRLLRIIRERGRVANAEVRAISGYNRAQARDFMTALRKEGQVILVGRGRAAHYVPAGSGKVARLNHCGGEGAKLAGSAFTQWPAPTRDMEKERER